MIKTKKKNISLKLKKQKRFIKKSLGWLLN